MIRYKFTYKLISQKTTERHNDKRLKDKKQFTKHNKEKLRLKDSI